MYFLLLESPKENLAVWHAAERHLKFISNCNEKINIICHSESVKDVNDFWTNSFKINNLLIYNNLLGLIRLFFKLSKDYFFCLSFKEVIVIYIFTLFRNVETLYWVQGIVPEEDFLSTNSYFRRFLIKYAERFALRIASKYILVSSHMKQYMETTRNMVFKNFIIIPCTSDLIIVNKVRIKNSYVYIGGTSAWQKIDRILNMFNYILNENSNSKLFIITYDSNKIKELIELHIPSKFHNNISIDSIVDRYEIANFLSTMEYGFLIRDDDPINYVSSPIKLAEYLSCGVNVILSSSVKSFVAPIIENKCGIIIEKDDDIRQISSFSNSAEKALKLYNELFNDIKMEKEYKKLFKHL